MKLFAKQKHRQLSLPFSERRHILVNSSNYLTISYRPDSIKMELSPFLSSTQLRRLNEHKYSVQGASVLDGLLQPWWNLVVQGLPLWVAPNLITLVGLVINIVTSLVLVYFNPTASQEVYSNVVRTYKHHLLLIEYYFHFQTPRWAALLCAAGIFIYQTLDAIDGKQARRTGSSTPLGELFDHGCDSISTGKTPSRFFCSLLLIFPH